MSVADPDNLMPSPDYWPDAIEEWRDCPSYPGYQASSHGRVRSVDRVLQLRNGHLQSHRGQMLKPVRHKNHLIVTVTARRRHQVAALVLDAFVGPRPKGSLACHKDDDGSNNVPGNLYWGNKSSNALDTVRLGTHGKVKKKTCPRNHLLADPNLVPWQAARGHRSCLACARAYSRVGGQKKRGAEVDFEGWANKFYEEIMCCPSCLHGPEQHGVTGCTATDNLGNRCACTLDSRTL